MSFDKKKYSDEETQSFKKYPTKDEWVNGFLQRTIENCYNGLKGNKYMLINIANTPKYKFIEEETVRISKELGFILPSVRITDDLNLGADEYTIKLGHTIVGQNQVFPDKLLAIPGSESDIKISGIEVKDPSFGMNATWILPSQQNEAEEKNAS